MKLTNREIRKLRIVSRSSMAFFDRKEAGLLLSNELKGLKGKDTVALGILRGGIIVALEVALKIGAELDIVLSRKIGAPMNPELAVGAVSENGELFVNKEAAASTSANDGYIQQEKNRQMAEIRRRSSLFRKIKPKISLEGKTVVVIDDGVATGATLLAALWAASQEHPKELIAAIPVGPEEILKDLSKYADKLICLKTPPYFSAVGQFYLQFNQTSDEEVLNILKKYK